MKRKACENSYVSSKIRKVNFFIFVVNGLSLLKSLESDEVADVRYIQTIVSAFNSPYMSFKDDKPLVVVTHGDLLSNAERARVRVQLGEVLGIPPTTQIFDIPESSDPAETELTIVDMLCCSLEQAEKNLPHKRKRDVTKLLLQVMLVVGLLAFLVIVQGVLAILAIVLRFLTMLLNVVSACVPHDTLPQGPELPDYKMDWSRIGRWWSED